VKRNPLEHAHALIDWLPPEQLSAVVVVLEAMLDPVSLAIANAPVEGEEITAETAAALERARASLARGGGIPQDDQEGGSIL
jgi:hypothetical protein